MRSAQTNLLPHTRDGRRLYAVGVPVVRPSGEIQKVVVVTRDITKEAQLREQLAGAEALAARYRSELAELRGVTAPAPALVAASPSMVDLLQVVRRLATIESTVLLLGETGVGKQQITQEIHRVTYSPG